MNFVVLKSDSDYLNASSILSSETYVKSCFADMKKAKGIERVWILAVASLADAIGELGALCVRFRFGLLI